MKILPIASSILFLIISFSISVPQVKAADLGTSICEFVQSDDKKRLRSFLKQNKLKIRTVFPELRCNKENLLQFAATSGALSTGKLIISKLSKGVVSENIDFLTAKSPELLEVANKRVGG